MPRENLVLFLGKGDINQLSSIGTQINKRISLGLVWLIYVSDKKETVSPTIP